MSIVAARRCRRSRAPLPVASGRYLGVARGPTEQVMCSSPIRRILLVCLAAIAMVLLHTSGAKALPSYARQTGQECAACHNGFPELTPYGRLFKLNGYTFGGGQSELPPVAAMVIGS